MCLLNGLLSPTGVALFCGHLEKRVKVFTRVGLGQKAQHFLIALWLISPRHIVSKMATHNQQIVYTVSMCLCFC